MESSFWSLSGYRFISKQFNAVVDHSPNFLCSASSKRVHLMPQTTIYSCRRLPKNLGFPRRPKLPKELVIDLGFDHFTCKNEEETSITCTHVHVSKDERQAGEEEEEEEVKDYYANGNVVWEPDEIEAISSLFKGRIPQKPGILGRERPLPLPLPYKVRPLGLPTRKNVPRTTARQCISKQVYKNPTFLIGLAREIKSLAKEEEGVSVILNECARFLRKGSLSMTVRELGHMGLPERALQVLCWAEKQPHLFPDDRILAATVGVLARAHELRMPFDLDKFISLAGKSVCEAMVRGFIGGGNLKLAWKLLSAAKEGQRMLDAGVYAKLILELGNNPDKSVLVLDLLEELAAREDLGLTQQDCTAIMKVCTRLRKFEIVEGLYDWFRKSGGNPSVVMYTTLIHSRYSEKKYREAMAVIWEMEASNCLLDLPAYRVVMRLFVAMNDLPRTVRYFGKLKEAGFSPTFDIYRNVIKMYMVSGRVAKCKEVWREAEMAGFKLNECMRSEC